MRQREDFCDGFYMNLFGEGFHGCINYQNPKCRKYFKREEGVKGLGDFLYCCKDCRQDGEERMKKQKED